MTPSNCILVLAEIFACDATRLGHDNFSTAYEALATLADHAASSSMASDGERTQLTALAIVSRRIIRAHHDRDKAQLEFKALLESKDGGDGP